MINPWHNALFDGSENGDGEVASVGRRADLVENHAQFVFFAPQTKHRFHEIVAESGVEPRRANHHRPTATVRYVLLAFEFRAPINAVRTSRVVLAIGHVLRSVENVVGRNLYHPTAASLDGFGQIARRIGVEFSAEISVAFRLIDGGISRAVHDAVDLVFLDKLPDGFRVGDVEFRHVCIIINVLRMQFFQQLDFVSELSVAASD